MTAELCKLELEEQCEQVEVCKGHIGEGITAVLMLQCSVPVSHPVTVTATYRSKNSGYSIV